VVGSEVGDERRTGLEPRAWRALAVGSFAFTTTFWPWVMGTVFQLTGSYAIGLMLLSNVAFASLVYTAWRFISKDRRMAAT
jgi:hypothetical protein